MSTDPPAGASVAPAAATGVPCAIAVPGTIGEPLAVVLLVVTLLLVPPPLFLLFDEPEQAARIPPAAITLAPLSTRRRDARSRAASPARKAKRQAASRNSLSVEYFTF
jgi:hypothetical protein